ALFDATFDHILEVHQPKYLATLDHDEWRTAGTGNLVRALAHLFGERTSATIHVNANALRGTLADGPNGMAIPIREIHTTHSSLTRERHELSMKFGHVACPKIELLFGEHHDASTFRRFVR